MLTLLFAVQINSACSIVYNSNIDIDGCSFSGISHASDGGVIFCCGDYSSKIKNTMFFNISAGKGGALFHESNGNNNVSNVCASNCRALNNYHFGLIKLNNGNAVSGLNMVSVTYCSKNAEGSFTLLNQYGHIGFNNNNISENHVNYDGVTKFEVFHNLDCSFCTFCSNYYTNTNCLFIKSSIPSSSIIKSNFIGNNGGSTNHMICFDWYSQKILKECVIHSNIGPLFSVYGGTLTLDSCILNHSGLISSASIILLNTSLTFTASLFLTHFQTYFCPYIPSQTPAQSHYSTILRTYDQRCIQLSNIRLTHSTYMFPVFVSFIILK